MTRWIRVGLAVFVSLFWLCGCTGAGEPASEAKPEAKPADAAEEPPARKIPDLGSPLVDNVQDLKRLHPQQPVWLDRKLKRVIVVGEVCKASYELEFFASNRDREYEAAVVTDVKPSIVHAGLLALGAVPGRPAVVYPKFNPPSGAEVEIELYWKDKEGKRQHARAQDWIRNAKTKKPLDVNWVFGGSLFQVDQETGQRTYMADAGDFISVANVPIATFDLPMRSGSSLETRQFEAAADRMPPKGTPVTLVITPKVAAKR